MAQSPKSGRSQEPAQPTSIWREIRWDVPVLILAAAAFLINLLNPELSSAVMLAVFGVAMGWVGYRIYQKIQAVRSQS